MSCNCDKNDSHVLAVDKKASAPARLNIVYIHTHDTGRMIGPYDSRFDTPALNRLAERGTVFDHLYCVGPTCSPSRSGLLTGTMPHQNGMLGLAHRGFEIADMQRHLCRFLSRNGYETALCGMQHESQDPNLLGYYQVSICQKPEDEDLTAWDTENAEAACRFIRDKHSKPFFLSFGLVHTHRPYRELDDDIAVEQVEVPASLPETEKTREDMARFMTSVRRADNCIDKVISALEEQELLDRTMIFYTTDHGAAFPFMKCTLAESGTGVAGILYFPGNSRAGSRLEALISHLDIYPTFCDLLGLERPEWLEGKSFAKLLCDLEARDGLEAVNDCVFSETNYHAAYEPQRSIRTGRYRLIIRYDDDRIDSPDKGFPARCPRLSNIDEGLSKDYLLEKGYINSDKQIEQERLLADIYAAKSTRKAGLCKNHRFRYDEKLLFDLEEDPEELCNLAGESKYEEILHALEMRLTTWQKQTDDPLLSDGFMNTPSGSTINRQSCSDPDSTDKDDYE